MPQSELVQSVIRALDILRAVVEAPNGLRLNEAADACGLKVTTAHNLLRSLCARGFVLKDASGRFVSGTAIPELAHTHSSNRLLENAARLLPGVAKRLPKAVVTFSCMTPDSVRCLLRMSPDRPAQIQKPLNLTFAPYTSVSAICLQATAANADEFERRWNFQDCGLQRWQSIGNFSAAKAKARADKCFFWQTEGRFAAAFAIPDNYDIGFSMDVLPEGGIQYIRETAEHFISALNT